MGIVVIGATFVDIKGFPNDTYIPDGRNAGRVEYIHGGVARNVVEDIANMELRPTYLGIVDDTPMGADVIQKLKNHKVNTSYVKICPDGMGTWLAVFDSDGNVAGSISKRPNLLPVLDILEEKGDEIFSKADSVVLEVDIDKATVKKVFAIERRDFFQKFDCFICNEQEAGMLFLEDFSEMSPEELRAVLVEKVKRAKIPAMVVTMGERGSVYADLMGNNGMCPAKKVQVKDTSGAGDAFCAGVSAGLTYGKTLPEAVEIGTTLAASVIVSSENVCPRFQPQELGLDVNFSEE